MRFPVLLALLLVACPTSEKNRRPSVDSDTGTGSGCPDDASGDLPADVTWLSHEASGRSVAMSDETLSSAYQGYYGTYNLNTLEVYGANGFKLEAPATVVGARVTWKNLLEDDTPAVLTAWPDFSSDGYVFDIWHPYGSYTRCLGPADEGTSVTYTFSEPVEVSQPLHVFVGYHRDEVPVDEEGAGLFTAPELPWFSPVMGGGVEEPYTSGVRWPAFDPEFYHDGYVSPWNVFQVELAVQVHDTIPAEDKPYQKHPTFTTGGRVAWGDYDNDGWDDLMSAGPILYHNEGGELVDVTATAIPGGWVNGTGGGIWGDYDNDGWLDYFGQGGGTTAGELLLHNEGDGTFTDVTDPSGVSDLQEIVDCNGDGLPEYAPTEGAGFFDFDGDGFLDLYLAEYECWLGDDTVGYQDRLYRNNGDGTFAEVVDEAVIEPTTYQGRGVTTGDADRDGDTDLYVSDYRLTANLFYENQGDGTLVDVARENGTIGKYTDGAYGHTIGSVFGDIDNDGDFDLVAANLAHPFWIQFSDRTNVLMNDGSGMYENEADARGIYYRETHSNPVLFDADNDADLDLFITNVYEGRDSDFYVNDGDGYFTLQNYESGLVVQNGWGAAAADHDNDGDVDLVAWGLYENVSGNDQHWLQVRAVGAGGRVNTSAIGATVEVEAGGVTQIRTVSGGSGTSCQDSFTQHFGLGAATTVDRVSVEFPYGDVITVEDVAADQRLWIWSDGRSAVGIDGR